MIKAALFFAQKAVAHKFVQQCFQCVVAAVYIQNGQRLCKLAQADQHGGVKQLIHGANAARQHQKSIGSLLHHAFAAGHGVGIQHLGAKGA